MANINLFISYSHQERDTYLAELLTYLNEESCPNVKIWYDERISPGVDWDDTIKNSFNDAHIVLFLISQCFLISPYIREHELNPALERQNSGSCIVIPIFARNCSLQNFPEITKLQGLPKGMKFISDMGEEKWGHYTDIVQKINDIAIEIETDKNISAISNGGDAVKAAVAKKIEQLRTNKKIFLSVPDSDEGAKKRLAFLYQVEGKIKYEGWPYEIIPGKDDAGQMLKLGEQDRQKLISSWINDAIYSIHIVTSAHDLDEGINYIQYKLAKQHAADTAMYRSIIWLTKPEIKDQLNEEICMNPISVGNDYENIFDIIKNLDSEKDKKLMEMKKDFSTAKKVFMFYDFSKDNDSDLRIDLKSKIEENANVSVRFNAANQNLDQEKEELEKCDGALIFYGASDSQWFMMRQSILYDAKNVKAKAICVDNPDIDRKINRDVSKNEFQTIRGQQELDKGLSEFLAGMQN